MRQKPKLILAGGLGGLLLFGFALAGQKPQWKGSLTKEGDVIVVKNPKEPLYNEPILSLKEELSIGGAEAKGDYILSNPRGIAVDGNGNIFVLDLKEPVLRAFDNSGKYVKTIGRSGQGPGELGGAIVMTLLLEKNEIYVYEASNRRISVFSTSGSYLRQISVRGMTNDLKIDSRGNVFMMDFVRDTRLKPGLRQKVLKKMNPEMSKVLVEFTRYYLEENGKAFSPVDYWVIDDKDHLIYGDAKTYEIRYFNSDGKLARKIIRDYAPVKVTQRDIDEFRKIAVPPGEPPDESRAYRYSSYHSAYRSFFVDDRERLFVQTWQRSDDNRMDIHDIFDADGRFIGQVPLPCNASLFSLRIRIMRNNKLYTIEPDEEGYEVVKRYTVTWLKE